MAITINNILVGEGTISVDGDDLGATQEGAAVVWEPDMVDIEVDQFGDAAKVVQNRVKVSVRTTLAEGTLENLKLAWGKPDADLTTGVNTKTLSLGLWSVYPEEHSLVLVGNAPGTTASVTFNRTYTNHRAIQYSSSEHSLSRAENTAFPIDFRVLPDPTHTGEEYGSVVDETA